ncbi:sigma-70 family RNA polymerase sigma factor [Aquisphaera insulae]|uniref:sigma-70 family RNA polymerase sigma factor n=1 Tax=Aquisphaera insulae TaxID=2712864 RepID=UPI0013EC8F61|nr:sigma-70 family RNA polymerase sigma factor [Aquisphaera insulae]
MKEDRGALITTNAGQRLTSSEERLLLRELAECRLALESAPADRDISSLRERHATIRGRLALGSSWIVWSVVRRYRDRGVSLADLMQDGFCGLLEAIDRFDLANENELSTYAVWWIRQKLQCAVASGAYPVRLHPRGLQKVAEYSRVASQREVDGTPWEPASPTLRSLLAATRPCTLLDSADAGGSSRASSLAGDSDGAIRELEDRESLDVMLGALRPRERRVLKLRFGLGGEAEHTLGEAGRRLGVSKERIRQIQGDAIRKLRAMAHGTFEDAAPRLPSYLCHSLA